MDKKEFLLLPFVFLMCLNVFSQDNTKDYIVLNVLRPLKHDEVFQISERMILQDNNDYRYIVNIVNNNQTEKIMELKNIRQLILYDNQRGILLYGMKHYDIGEYKGNPLFIIDGVEGKIEYLDNFRPGFFLIEDNIIINRIYRQEQLTDDLFVYDITRRETICVYDMNAYLVSKLETMNKDRYEIGFPDYYEGKVKITNGRVKLYFDQWGEDGPDSFYSYLNIQDKRNIYAE